MLRRKTSLHSSKWGVSETPRTPLPKVNMEATAKRQARRARERNSATNKEARRIARERANSLCECGCGQPFDTDDGPKGRGAPEFHHDSYTPPAGRYLRRECHHRIEMAQFSYRHARQRRVG